MVREILRIYRSLIQSPGFFFAIMCTMTLGIGTNSAIFSVIDAVLLRQLPYPSADRLVAVYESSPRQRVVRGLVAPARLEDWNRMTDTFAGIAGAYTENLPETSGMLPEKLVAARVSPRFMSVLGTPPIVGRVFSPEEDRPNGPTAVMISERLWRRRFNSDPQVVQRSLRANGRSYSIVGVLPDTFRFPSDDVDAWTPARLPDAVMRVRERRFFAAVARLKEGITIGTAQSDLAAAQTRLALQY